MKTKKVWFTNIILILIAIFTICVIAITVIKTEKENEPTLSKAEIVQEIVNNEKVLEGESEEPEGFPHFHIYPNSQLIDNTYNESSAQANWIVHDDLNIVVSWYMYNCSETGWFLTSQPQDPSSTEFQEFTASKEGMTLTFSATKTTDGTKVHIETTY